jgi:hypothetical protein
VKSLGKLIALGIVAVVALTGCQSGPQPVSLKPISIPVIPPAQLAAQVCPVIRADLALLQSPSGASLLTPEQQAKVANTIAPASESVCAAAATVDLTSLQAFNDTAFPALIAIVGAVPGIPNQPAVLLALQLAQPLLQQAVSSAIAATKASAAAAAPARVVAQ